MRLGVNIDHVATLRELRGTPYPDLIEAARLVERAGAQQITVHLREDRRHIQDDDVRRLRQSIGIPLNLEMAATDAMVRFASKLKPDWSCLVPEKRQELTTEGGLELKRGSRRISRTIAKLKKAGIRVSLFVEPSQDAMKRSRDLGADAVELHTGRYCLATQIAKGEARAARELTRIQQAAELGWQLGLQVHAGHGFDYVNVRPVAALERVVGSARHPLIAEYNIGHSIVCRAALVGLERAVREMISSIQAP